MELCLSSISAPYKDGGIDIAVTTSIEPKWFVTNVRQTILSQLLFWSRWNTDDPSKAAPRDTLYCCRQKQRSHYNAQVWLVELCVTVKFRKSNLTVKFCIYLWTRLYQSHLKGRRSNGKTQRRHRTA
jgi:hypothetical protein